MLLYHDTAAAALHAATDEARRLGATRHETAHVLLGHCGRPIRSPRP